MGASVRRGRPVGYPDLAVELLEQVVDRKVQAGISGSTVTVSPRRNTVGASGALAR